MGKRRWGKISRSNFEAGRIEPSGDEEDYGVNDDSEDYDGPDDNVSIDEDGTKHYGR